MKKIKKSKLVIENKKMTIKEDSDYESLSKAMPAGDIVKFGKESLKLLGNIASYWLKSGWATFRYNVLNDVTKKDFEASLKNGRITFLSNADRNISNIDSTTATLLSKAGVSKSEIDSYLLGFPGFNVLDKIDATNILTGRIFNASRYNKINMTSVGPEDLLIFFAIAELSNGLGEDLKTKTDADIFSLVTKINDDIRNTLIAQIKNQLSSETDLMRKLKALTKSTDENLLSDVRKIMRALGNQPGRITNDSDAQKFCDLVNKELPKIKMSVTDSYKLSIKDRKLIKEESTRDDSNLVILSFLHSISKSALYLNKNLTKELLEDILSKSGLNSNGNVNIKDFDKLKNMLEEIAIALWSGQAAVMGAKIVNEPDIVKSTNTADLVDVDATFKRYKVSIETSFKAIESIISSADKKTALEKQKSTLDNIIDEKFINSEQSDSRMPVDNFKTIIAAPIVKDAKDAMFKKDEIDKFKEFMKIVESQFNKSFLSGIDKNLPVLIDYCSSESLKSVDGELK